jgi:hypothetical protein
MVQVRNTEAITRGDGFIVTSTKAVGVQLPSTDGTAGSVVELYRSSRGTQAPHRMNGQALPRLPWADSFGNSIVAWRGTSETYVVPCLLSDSDVVVNSVWLSKCLVRMRRAAT